MNANTTTHSAVSIRELCYSAIFAAIISVLAQLSIPLPGGVPLTLQTLAVMLSGIILGARCGSIAVIIYILLGAVGLPVYSGFKGGLSSLLGPTGGFIISFWTISICSGLGMQFAGRAKRNIGSLRLYYLIIAASILIGAILNYTVGVVWFSSTTGNNAATALKLCVLPFIVTDLIKVALATAFGPMLAKALRRNGL